MEEEKGFKELFLDNLHPQYGPHMGAVDLQVKTMDDLRRMASYSFRRFKDSSKSEDTPSVLAVEADPSTLRLEGTTSGTGKAKNCKPSAKLKAQNSYVALRSVT
uniref:Uncharacterized protein n=1 Tax=Nothobranchius furzeri TaxID=105023 RepID=A0A1A8U924_NOTFU